MEQVSPDQAQFLAMLVQIMGAERCIEVGVFHVSKHEVSGFSLSSLIFFFPMLACIGGQNLG
jgi:hypothetical protein